jgi:hypothetical protein
VLYLTKYKQVSFKTIRNGYKWGGWIMFTKSITIVLVAGVTALTAVHAADDNLSQASAWVGKLKTVSTGQHSGEQCFETTGYSKITSKKIYKIDPAKNYFLSGWFKSVGKQPGRLYFGFLPLDKNKKQIYSLSVNTVAKTDTVLAAACKPEDKVIKIKDGLKWKKHKYALIAFNTDTEGKYKDLPNLTTSPCGITSIEKQGDVWVVTLVKACGKAFPAGTPVREHLSTSSYQYCGVGNAKIPAEWKEYSATVKGIGIVNIPNKEFWPGTAYVRIIMLINLQSKDDELMLWDDIKLEEK